MSDGVKRDVVDEEDEVILREIADRQGLPIDYRAEGGVIAESRLISKPSTSELRAFARTRVRTCGSCKHFNRDAFQKVAHPFMKQLVHEMQWDPKFSGDKPENMGRGGQNDELVVGPNSLGCSAYRAK